MCFAQLPFQPFEMLLQFLDPILGLMTGNYFCLGVTVEFFIFCLQPLNVLFQILRVIGDIQRPLLSFFAGTHGRAQLIA